MTNQNDYNLPNDKKGKVELLKAILKGKVTIDDLKESEVSISIWKEDPANPAYMVNANGQGRKSKADYNEDIRTGRVVMVTLDLSK